MSVRKRLEALEGRASEAIPEDVERRKRVRERMKAVLDELAAAKREGREDDTRRQSQEGGSLRGFTSTRKGEILVGWEDSVPTEYWYATPTY